MKSSYCKSRQAWNDMMRRCYDANFLARKPTYKGCVVCEEWQDYKNFKEWYDTNYYQIDDMIMCLDKDILIKGNKEYAPDRCIFVPYVINNLFTKCNKKRGLYPIGVSKDQGRYKSKGNLNGHSVTLGLFGTIQEAFTTYKEQKEDRVKQIATQYKGNIPDSLYQSLMRYEVNAND